MLRSHASRLRRVDRAVEALELTPAIWKTCPWEPRALIETGLRQWLRCAGAALLDDQLIGMPSHAVDEAWHGLILCTARYERFCDDAYGRFLHHFPDGDRAPGAPPRKPSGVDDSMDAQLGRTVAAWSLVARPDEACVLWDLDQRLGLDHPWGVAPGLVAAVDAGVVEPNAPPSAEHGPLG